LPHLESSKYWRNSKIPLSESSEDAMSRAWKDKYHGISQVSSSVFMAYFKSQDDMISVYIKQPLVAYLENLLVDWFDPNLNATSSADFKFDNILVRYPGTKDLLIC
jgi:hypothetical protein